MTLSAAFLGNLGYQTTAEDVRQLVKAMFGETTGLLELGDFTVTPGTDLAVSVSSGRAVLQGLNTAAQGAYFVWSTLSEEIECNVPHASLHRIDTLLLRISDSQYGTITGSQGPQWVWATGTPNASPVRLSDAEIAATYAQPGAYMRVADVRINAGATQIVSGNITQPGLVVVGGSIQSYTPTWTNTGGATFTHNVGYYKSDGDMFWVNIDTIVNASGSGSTIVTVSLPYTPSRANSQVLNGFLYAGGSEPYRAAVGMILSGGSGAVVNAIRTQDGTTLNELEPLAGSGLQSGRNVILQGWLRKA